MTSGRTEVTPAQGMKHPGTPRPPHQKQQMPAGAGASPDKAAGVADVGIAVTTIVRELSLDIGLPVATYFGLYIIGVTGWAAMLAATLVAVLRLIWVAVRGRTLNLFAMVMTVVFGLDLALYFVTGDVRVELIKGSIAIAVLGIMFLVLVALGHPPTLEAVKVWEPKRAAWRAEQFRTNPMVRHRYRTVSTVWGAGFLAEALVLVPLIYSLPSHVMRVVSPALGIVWLGALIGWTGWYQKH